MADPVFANAMQVSSKAMGGKSICQFPDVCFTPPESPATPPGVPIPYPNTGMAGDTSDGSRSVQIGGEEIMLKDRSAFKQSTGDEAGQTAKKGLINSKLQGKVYFIAWSMDVMIEGENVVRNLDLTTHNHASIPANGSVPTPHVAAAALAEIGGCGKDAAKVTEKCSGDQQHKPACPGNLNKTVTEQRSLFKKGPVSRTAQAAKAATAEADANACVKAMRCFLRPYKPKKDQHACCPGQTAHHIPPKACMKKIKAYSERSALCVCLEGAGLVGSHGKNHSAINYLAKQGDLKTNSTCSTGKYNGICAKAVAAQCNCDPACIEKQLKDSMQDFPADAQVTHRPSGAQLTAAETTEFQNQLKALPKRAAG